jgi:type II secretion system protein C
MMRALSVVLFSLSIAACGGAPAGSKTAKAPAPAAAADKPAAPQTGEHTLRRSVVKSVVKAGLGMFLQKVELDDQPVKQDGRFHGFRITALHDPAFWAGIDLRPGDVVTKVNGMSIEHPEEALEAFHSLEVASELRVAYERDGAAHELAYSIVDDEPQKRAGSSAP